MRQRSTRKSVVRYVLLGVYTLFVVLPLYEMLAASLEPLKYIISPAFHFWPKHVNVSAYFHMWKTIPLARYFMNSIVVSGVATLLSILIALFASYAFSRFEFRGKTSFGWVLLATQMFPGILFLLPIYVMFIYIQSHTGIHFTGTYQGLIITYMTFALPFSVWMLKGYFEGIPKSLDEAAKIDGSSHLRIIFQILFPLALPGIIATAVFAFITAWNELLFATVLTSSATKTITIGLESYASRSVIHWGQLMAASLTVTIPIVVAFLLVQKYFLYGFAGSVKE
ncbi:carbohydrate ABC transporter permease [Alicyclobacillus sp. SO9]|uniref:carbohydrate ABC transporter permease n=1 Tax=Alicyclobacillus sp. SO9 TaxID=2665646 RepID=UPI0018E76EA8|nr:carbohydrate ABC transporter permease [Alicyclobacillus sp. SO9]QQE80521.1 carbohydrate ABC transporter permease [Alicyclobacillus sp. SO9]